VRVPALIINGDADKPIPVETSGKLVLAEQIPDTRLVIVTDTGHFPHMEKPNWLMKQSGNGSKRNFYKGNR
jgi:pimeloyl-ACP methyl ester carboxylesterase